MIDWCDEFEFGRRERIGNWETHFYLEFASLSISKRNIVYWTLYGVFAGPEIVPFHSKRLSSDTGPVRLDAIARGEVPIVTP